MVDDKKTGGLDAEGYAALRATIRRDRAKQKAVTIEEILAWRHEGHER